MTNRSFRNVTWRGKVASFLFLFLFLCSVASNVRAVEPGNAWKPAGDKLLSVFAKDVNPTMPLPEYPRPQMARRDWKNLNGLWDYTIVPENEKQLPAEYQGKILVPFPIESALSGVGKRVGKTNRLFYKRSFDVPATWKDDKVLLHFGAVDWDAEVFVNGTSVGTHQGGYSGFQFDITAALKSGTNELVVSVWDPTDDRATQPRGKQTNNPHGIWYTPVTGIWQTVWMEPVAKSFIDRIVVTPNLSDKTATVKVTIAGNDSADSDAKNRWTVRATLRSSVVRQTATSVSTSQQNAVVQRTAGEPIVLKIANPVLWTPDQPHLYDLTVELLQGNTVVDKVESYFAMRDIKLGKSEDGLTRILLNGKFLFQHGPLDQGWWPDGLYTAPTDAALKYDVEMTKKFGYNMLRKHVKVEPMRFYYHCDKLGVLVWQDMPSGDRGIGSRDPDIIRTPESAAIYEKELKEMMTMLENVPSIIIWVPFNEGWGQFDTARITDLTREWDPTRLIISASGWTDRGTGDIHDIHRYPGPGMPAPEEKRAIVLGEYGGLGLPVKDHVWQDNGNWGYQSFDDREKLFDRYEQLNRAMHPLIGAGLSAAVYTQTTDVEIETNGLMTYDRAVLKFDVDKMAKSNDSLHYPAPKVVTLLPTAKERTESLECKYTFTKPSDGWEKADFDDSSWKTGQFGFGTRGTPNATIGTVWNTSDIWLRVVSDDISEAELNSLDLNAVQLNIHYDEDPTVYINGEKVFEANGYTTDYQRMPFIAGSLKKAMKPGKHVIAIHCVNRAGGQFIDFGVSIILPPDPSEKPVW